MTLASDALAVARAGIRAADPRDAVARVLRSVRGGIAVGSRTIRPAEGGRYHLVALGKAAAAMADAAARRIGPDVDGIVVTPHGYPSPRSGLPTVFGEHPLPGSGSLEAGRALLEFVRSTRTADAVVFLISGGGSAVAEVPTPPLRLHEVRDATEVLLASGAPIGAMNAVRRHLSEIKGGRLALATRAERRVTVALSDVVGDLPRDIASGPTVGDPTTFAGALEAVRAYRIGALLPGAVLRHLREGARGRWAETPKPSNTVLRRAPFVLAATNRDALRACGRAARLRGYLPRFGSNRVIGETQPAARSFARQLIRLAERSTGPVCLLSGGETTVTLGPKPGRGGRNQEFALAAAAELRGRPALVLSVGTDGVDGPTDAAGGWTDGKSTARADRSGVDLAGALAAHAAYDALRSLGGLVRTGPTGTNVMDLHVGLARPVNPGTEGNNPQRAAPSSRRRRS